jgi:hypothetical protein
MGSVPRELASALKTDLRLRRAIETGTGLGISTAILADIFEEVISIELSPELHEAARVALSDRTNVRLVCGESSKELPLVDEVEAPTFYFLDAHWSAGRTAGRESECPLLAELAALIPRRASTAVVIDDARLFSSPPPPPHDPAQWPTLIEVEVQLARLNPDFEVSVVEDQIVAVPPAGRPAVERWRQLVRHRERLARRRSWLKRICRSPQALRRRLQERLDRG